MAKPYRKHEVLQIPGSHEAICERASILDPLYPKRDRRAAKADLMRLVVRWRHRVEELVKLGHDRGVFKFDVAANCRPAGASFRANTRVCGCFFCPFCWARQRARRPFEFLEGTGFVGAESGRTLDLGRTARREALPEFSTTSAARSFIRGAAEDRVQSFRERHFLSGVVVARAFPAKRPGFVAVDVASVAIKEDADGTAKVADLRKAVATAFAYPPELLTGDAATLKKMADDFRNVRMTRFWPLRDRRADEAIEEMEFSHE